MQLLVISTLRRDTQRPSLVQVWHMPQEAALPMPSLLRRKLPLEAQDTSYFAPSARIFNLSIMSIATTFTSPGSLTKGSICLRHNMSFLYHLDAVAAPGVSVWGKMFRLGRSPVHACVNRSTTG